MSCWEVIHGSSVSGKASGRRETDQTSQRNGPTSGQGNLRLTPEGGTHMVLRKDKVEIGNSE